ncbi:hypothetical protein BWQ96_07520 [Gracilariopsis chorda]|uniref:Uncharacterized protein n=1 Tax=Gracilariopsis chorda TaxID=448386 RepID=A0A2V3IKT9_9FLOR|nr:hypothetical protein BWQ96_07520 [Gracilariopsis chorda]|eukprot:PXF42705.1 hypothetical protein BWQ96_07520 [Gracilariopsis chorda]
MSDEEGNIARGALSHSLLRQPVAYTKPWSDDWFPGNVPYSKREDQGFERADVPPKQDHEEIPSLNFIGMPVPSAVLLNSACLEQHTECLTSMFTDSDSSEMIPLLLKYGSVAETLSRLSRTLRACLLDYSQLPQEPSSEQAAKLISIILPMSALSKRAMSSVESDWEKSKISTEEPVDWNNLSLSQNTP